MKKLLALVLALCLMLGCSAAYATSFEALQDMLRNAANGGEEPEETQEPQEESQDGVFVAEGADGLSVTKYHVMTKESTNYVYVYLFLEVTNNGSSAVETDGEFYVYDTAGKEVEDQSYLNTYPAVLGPGQTGYVSEYVMVSKKDTGVKSGNDIGQVRMKLYRESYNRNPDLPTFAQSAGEVGAGKDKYGNQQAHVYRVAVANNTGSDLTSPHVVVALYDNQGRLVYVDQSQVNCFSGVTIPNGNGLVVEGNVPTDLSEGIVAAGIVVDSIQTLAYVD